MSYCPNCGCPTCARRRMPGAVEGQLQAYAASLQPHHNLTWHTTLTGDGKINAWLDGKPLIGNKTVAQVREMVLAMGAVAVMPS